MQIDSLLHAVHFRLHYALMSTFGFLPPSLVHLEQERSCILFPLSCQTSVNSFHGWILLTFLKLGTCKVFLLKLHCCRRSHSGAELQVQATSRGYHHPAALPLVLLRSDFPHSFSTLLLSFSGKCSGLYVPGGEDDLAEIIAWKICVFHTPRIS